jgi:DNA polymerase III alpha subunit
MQAKNSKMYVEDNDIIELMLANRQAKILPSNRQSFNQFEKLCQSYNLKVPFRIEEDSDDLTWNLPEEYRNIDIRSYVFGKHQLTLDQKNRVDAELEEFEKRNLNDLLRFLVYFVKLLRDNNIVYGVGRGSSIASYVLYLIGVHRIDSLKYNLDIKEFLK